MAAAAVAQPPAAVVPDPPVTDPAPIADKPAAKKKPPTKKAAPKPAAPDVKAAEPEGSENGAEKQTPVDAAATPEAAPAPAPAPVKPAAKKAVAKPKPAEPVENGTAKEPPNPTSTTTEAPPNDAANPENEKPKANPTKTVAKKAVAEKPKVTVNGSAKLSRNSEETKARMDQLLSLWKDFQETEQMHNKRIGDIESRLKLAENEITRLGKFCGEYQLLWKIRDYRRVYEEATNETRITIQSPIFDTHRNGYKMQLSMCPNGDGKGKGQAMSIFFTIVKGPYDTILPWPFLCPVKITLVDQQGASSSGKNGNQPSRDIVRTFSPNPRPENEPFLGRPAEDRNMSLGFPRFIQLTDLFTGGYIKEESLYIKVYVDITGVVRSSID